MSLKLKIFIVTMFLATMDFTVACFPGLSQAEFNEQKEQIKKNEPSFYD